ncbi:hypothetical protein NF865_05300 [Thermococcus aggregans]|uniref:Uncharacterized protein n=1 Tax=Thermococcus aggregans TaxID=110163 RepID=A0A9E7SQG7_THEAG|nr:hypothetical protein [Thermococcus aggregans]USS41575.1 hypothetical protein NF865_05300 [Thermococcus aggregans]
MHELDKAIFKFLMSSSGTIASNLKPYLSLALEIYGIFEIISKFIQWRREVERKRRLRKSLANTFQKKLDKAKRDLEQLADDIAYAFGALFMYSITIPPFEPKEKAQRIVNQIERDYKELTKSMYELMKLVRRHRNMIIDALDLDETQILLLDGLAIAFKNKTPDIESLTDYLPLIAEEMQKSEKERQIFSQELGKQIGKFNSTYGLVIINHALGINRQYKQCFKKAARYGIEEFLRRFNECRTRPKQKYVPPKRKKRL